MNKIQFKLFVLSFAIICCFTIPAYSADTLHVEEIASGLSAPVFVCSPDNDSRLFIVEQTGTILIYENDSLLTEPFLNITNKVRYGGEQGLLGMAFHPNYASNGQFFVNYTTIHNNQLNTRIARYNVDGSDPNLADTLTEEHVMHVFQPNTNHNGGMLAFGPDGYLYIGLGDGGGFNDQQNYGQNRQSLLGKMLRIDINLGLPYVIPNDNPFVDSASTLNEIWAIGLRNPWRYAFDRLTGDLIIADVGQGALEEIDFQDSASTGGINYGWRLKEGTQCFNPPTNCDTVPLIDPIHEYPRGGNPFRCSITGGYIYRGTCLPQYDGNYFYADYCSNQIWSFKYNGSIVSDSMEYIPSIQLQDIVSFGEDADGEMYIVCLNGFVYRIVPQGGSAQCNASDCCQGIRGNVDNDGLDQIDISDLVYFVDYSFGNPSGPAPFCTTEADVNADLSLDISDIVYLVSYMFGSPSGPAPLNC